MKGRKQTRPLSDEPTRKHEVLSITHVHSPYGYAQLRELNEIMENTARARDVSTVYAPGKGKYARPLAYNKPSEREARALVIERRTRQPEFAKLRDAFGALHTELLCGDFNYRRHTNKARAELARVIAWAAEFDKVLAERAENLSRSETV